MLTLLNKTLRKQIVNKSYFLSLVNLPNSPQTRSFHNKQTNCQFETNFRSLKRLYTQTPEIQDLLHGKDRYSIQGSDQTLKDHSGQEKFTFPMQVPLVPLLNRPLFPGVTIQTILPPFRRTKENPSQKVAFFFVKDYQMQPEMRQGDEGFAREHKKKKTLRQKFSDFFISKTSKGNPLENLPGIGTLAVINPSDVPHSLHSVVSCTGLERVKALKITPSQKHFLIDIDMVNAGSINDNNDSTGFGGFSIDPEEALRYKKIIFDLLKELIVLKPFFADSVQYLLQNIKKFSLSSLLDLSCSITTSRGTELQGVLGTIPTSKRFQLVKELLKEEIKFSKVRQHVMKTVSQRLSIEQKKIYLEKQMKEIKSELGIQGKGNWDIIQKFRKQMGEKQYPKHAKDVIEEQFEKLTQLNVSSLEFNTTRNYLDWLIKLPWMTYQKENLDILLAKEILDEDHYGLADVKKRILEFIAVGNLKGSLHGKILCLVGPPGVGKTSIGKSLSRALNREFFRYSLGGLSDSSALKGFKRTYIGALPGLFIQGMKNLKTSNPVFVLDEVDKLGVSYKGDPSSALLEALDPEQNSEFLDHFLDVSYDLSKVLFVMTANVTSTIPSPLLDRMEVIRISGYVEEEKLQIAKKYLIKKVQKETGIKENQVKITENAIRTLIRDYCREAGVRNLQKNLEKIHRKIAYKIAISNKNSTDSTTTSTSTSQQKEVEESQEEKQQQQKHQLVNFPIIVEEKDLQEYLGKAIFLGDRIFKKTGVGVVTGLAWSHFGGALSYIESIKTEFDEINEETSQDKKKGKKKGSHKITGQLGEVMKESSLISYTFAKKFLREKEPNNTFLEESHIHTHCPEGAIPKDGPSAGVTIVTSLISLALQKPVKEDFAMTGEITLSGKVLPIGGLKEKVLAARRSGINQLIFPKENERDWYELEDYITKGITPHFVQKYDDIYKILF
ncbi:lon protease [Anaeramoeba flamelloides]|uniref:Lon protease homolog n=1 Tax=Anaeramoeba flamelloides TaxID=1746091 RepID=A0ABQ8YZE7_9EUKA|nr:lon protease [Anaeramoeba flamelloides]